MPCWRSVDSRARPLAPLLLWLALGLAPSSSIVCRPAHAAPDGAEPDGAGFAVEHAALRAVGGRYVADARIRFAFSEDNLEAMRNGVALTVIVDVEILHERARWWNETLAARELRYRIETNVLTGRYRIWNFTEASARSYHSFEEMVDALGRLRSIPVIPRDRVPDGACCIARIRARLDIEALPSPLRPLAYLSPQWRLNSGWVEWRIER